MEWTVVTVLIAIVGFLAVVCKPMLDLNANITKLNTLLEGLTDRLNKVENDNTNSHRRIWENLNNKDKKIDDHEHRITILEQGGNQK